MGALVAVLREQDQSYLDSLGHNSTVEVVDGFVNVVLADFPTAGLDRPHVDLLLRLPFGFPDATPDMFWVSPALTAKGAAIAGTGADREPHWSALAAMEPSHRGPVAPGRGQP